MLGKLSLVLVLAWTPVSAQEVIDGSDASVPAEIMAGIKDAFAEDVVDPLSTQLRNLQLYHDPATREDNVCGLFNTKNRLGGYVGFSVFHYFPRHKRLAFNSPLCP